MAARVLLLLILIYLSALTPVFSYAVPEPIIEIYNPKGLRISIPDDAGIELFAFHGNINEPMVNQHAGQISRNVMERIGDWWVVEDRDVVLRICDRIYYRMFIVRSGLGYRRDNGMYVVRETKPAPWSSALSTPAPTPKTTVTVSPFDEDLKPETCDKLMLNLTHKLLTLQNRLDDMYTTNKILFSIAEKQSGSKYLTLDGEIPKERNPVEAASLVIKQKLSLRTPIVSAKRNQDESITFEVVSLSEKIRVLKAAKERLKHSRIILSGW